MTAIAACCSRSSQAPVCSGSSRRRAAQGRLPPAALSVQRTRRHPRPLAVAAGPQEAQQQPQQQPQQAPAAAPPPPPPPPAAFTQQAPGRTSHTQDLYSSSAQPITRFGFAKGLEDKYELAEQVGSGTFGVVHIAVHRQTRERYAVKSMPKRFSAGGTLEPYYVRRVRNEVDICNHLGRSLNVCYLYEVFEDDKGVDLVMELCSGGQLWDKIRAGSYSEAAARRLVREMARAVAQCHGMNVMLRDIKPENFMFLNSSPDAPLKAIDFGISVFCAPGQYVDVRAGTPIYIAPEVLRMKYTLSADIWSLGIVSYQLLTGRLPFAGEEGQEVSELYMETQKYDNKEVFRAVLFADLDFESPPWDTLSDAAKDFVQACLRRDETQRPTAEQLLQHPWLQDDCDVSDAPFDDTIVQRLQRYGLYGRFRQVALRALIGSLAEGGASAGAGAAGASSSQTAAPQLAVMRAAFERLDRDGDGRVTYAELRDALQDPGHFKLSAGEVEQLLGQVSLASDGTIAWEEWVAAMADWRVLQGSEDWDRLVGRAFASLDPNGDGVISAEELEALLCGPTGCEFPDEVEAALREADRDHDGTISEQDFRAFLDAATDDRLDLFDARVSRDGAGSGSDGSGSDAPGKSGGPGPADG